MCLGRLPELTVGTIGEIRDDGLGTSCSNFRSSAFGKVYDEIQAGDAKERLEQMTIREAFELKDAEPVLGETIVGIMPAVREIADVRARTLGLVRVRQGVGDPVHRVIRVEKAIADESREGLHMPRPVQHEIDELAAAAEESTIWAPVPIG